MQDVDEIQFLTNKEIDKCKWDECIDLSAQGLIYAKSFYLDNICENWSALTSKNYDWVVPITARKKFGINYLYQPAFCQQLGVFAKLGIVVPYDEIISAMKQRYYFWEINWNSVSASLVESKYLNIEKATNFVVNLADDYTNIYKKYHNHLQRNLKRSGKYFQQYRQTNDYIKYIELYQKLYAKRTPHVKDNDYKNLQKICCYASEKKMLFCREATTYKNETLAAAILFCDEKRLYNLINITTDEGRKSASNHFLLDAVIKEFSGRNLLFDFEGSDLPGVKIFYENFGGKNEFYCRFKYNSLPWPLNILKR